MTAQRDGSCWSIGLTAAVAIGVGTPAWTEIPAPGLAVYDKWCAPCHDPGMNHAGTHALLVKYQGVKSGVLLEWTDLPASNVKHFVRHGISSMPPFRKTEISDAELDALAAYLSRNTKDH
jgi:(+)-pinoresinol hydroxylase